MPLIRQRMEDFVKTGGKAVAEKEVYVKNTPLLVEQPKGGDDPYAHLTPKERMQKRKEDEIKRKQDELTQAVRGAKDNYSHAKERMLQELHAGSGKYQAS